MVVQTILFRTLLEFVQERGRVHRVHSAQTLLSTTRQVDLLVLEVGALGRLREWVGGGVEWVVAWRSGCSVGGKQVVEWGGKKVEMKVK